MAFQVETFPLYEIIAQIGIEATFGIRLLRQ